jgi:lysophospholipase L1-like esterase
LIFSLAGLALGWVAYNRVTSGALNFITFLVLMSAACVGLFLLADLVSVGRLSAYRHRLRLLAVTLGLLALGTELVLRFSVPSLRTYFERNGETTYRTLSRNTGATWFHLYDPDEDVTWTTADFVHARRTNELGLSEAPMKLEKAPREYRIVALGDSFTEGVGADYQSSWVKVMERALAARLPERVVTTLNAGISGSDVFFEYMLLKEKLVAYSPDLVIVAVNNSDVADVMLRGGMERFQPDGTYRSPREPPWWEWLYGTSFVARLVVHSGLGYDYLFIERSRQDIEQREAVDNIRSLIPAFAELASEYHFRLLVVLQPTRNDARDRVYGYDLGRLITDLRQGAGFEWVDVLARWSAAGHPTHEEWLAWYWPTDEHHTPRGYAVLGSTIVEALLESGSSAEAAPAVSR